MTRQDIERDYDVDAHGIIRSPGKFEGEPWYVVHFWDMGLQGFADEDSGKVYGFHLTADDKALDEDLTPGWWLYLEETEQGFVNSLLTATKQGFEDDSDPE